jgi:hypothetical protein
MESRVHRLTTELASLRSGILRKPHLVHTHVYTRPERSKRDLLDRVCLSNG